MMTDEELEQAMFLLGPWLIGCVLDVMFQGVLFCQFAHYWEYNQNKELSTHLAVLGLAILTTLKTIHSFAIAWVQFILHFNDLQSAIALNYNAWWQTGSALMVASIGGYVQVYFCHRLYSISGGNLWFVVPIVIILVFAYLSIALATYYISRGVDASPQMAVWFANHLSAVFAGDVMMTLSTAFFLIQSRKEVLPETAGLITSLIRLTFQTAAPAAICATFNLIFSQVYSGEDKLISVAFNSALPKLYGLSMMWTLNARHSLRTEYASSRYTTEDSYGLRVDDITFGFKTNANETSIELDNLQSHTNAEAQPVDMTAMFNKRPVTIEVPDRRIQK